MGFKRKAQSAWRMAALEFGNQGYGIWDLGFGIGDAIAWLPISKSPNNPIT